MPGIDFRRLKEIITLGEVMRVLAIGPTRGGKVIRRGNCPLGCTSTPWTCTFNGHSHLWYCHRCKIGGSALDLYARVKRLTIFAAALDLCQQLNQPVPYLVPVRSRKDDSVRNHAMDVDDDDSYLQ
jgi:hypothetical protein